MKNNIENCRKILRVIGVVLGLWGIVILLISFPSLKNHFKSTIADNQNVHEQIEFCYQTFILFTYLVFLPITTSLFLLLITKKSSKQ
jgi:hypothetical protein